MKYGDLITDVVKFPKFPIDQNCQVCYSSKTIDDTLIHIETN